FGVMLCEMLTGRNPFAHDQIAATITAILNAPTPDLETERPDAPVALIDLIYRMLAKNPADRIASMRLIGAELEAILQGGALSTHHHAPQVKDLGPTVYVQITPVQPAASPDPAAKQPIDKPVRHSLKHGLHSHQTPFVGREHDLIQIDKLMTDPTINLVTLSAPGGMGKTRLALEYATRKVGKYPNGVYFVPLAGITRREDVVLAIADSIRFGFAIMGEREQQLLDFLKQPGEQHMLLVLDNLEHILDEVGPLISAILRHAPDIHILTTSRARLNLASEIVYEVGGMHIPDDLIPEQQRDHEAVQLFANSAQRSLPGFKLRDADLPDVLRIGRAVYGNPLGIVLAGAWVGMLSPKEIADEVAISLDFLQTDAHDIPERQRSLRAVFDSSMNMLTDTERDAFMKLSIFRGGVKRTVAQYITGASLNTLAALVKKSLIWRDPNSGRYEVHELLRQYAAEALDAAGGTERTRDIHGYYFMSLTAQQIANLRGADQAEAIRTLDADYENIRVAWDWAVQRHNTAWLALGLEGVFLFCMMTGEFDAMTEMMHTAARRLTAHPETGSEPIPADDHHRLWRQIAIRGQLARTPHSDPLVIEDLLDMAREASDPAEEAFGLWTLGYAQCAAKHYEAAVKSFEASFEIYEKIADPFFMGRLMSDVGVFRAVIGDHERSIMLLMLAGQIQEPAGDVVGLTQSQMRMMLNYDYLPPEIKALMAGRG
ncbi:MAG: hypothetical protein JXA10_15035, partial [Anaerolineae bacterium]|nr:hypothetical protein [Anaerolineae bacterium]